MNEAAMQLLVNHFIKENKIDLATWIIDEARGDNYYPDFYDLFQEKWISQLSNVNNISFRHIFDDFGTFSDFPEELFHFNKITSIDFGNNDFESIPDSILKLNSLESISFSENSLTKFPEVLTKHKTLQSVGLQGNPFVAHSFLYEYSYDISFISIRDKLIEFYINNPGEYFEFNQFNWGVYLKRKDINIYICNEADISVFYSSKWGNHYDWERHFGEYDNLEVGDFRYGWHGISLIIEKRNNNSIINAGQIYKEFFNVFRKVCRLKYKDVKLYVATGILKVYQKGGKYYHWLSLNELKTLRDEEKEMIQTQNGVALYITDLIKQIGGLELLKEIEFEITKKKKENVIKFDYINHLSIYNFKFFERIEISDISHSVNVVIGLNGLGKTTLLQAIALGFLHPNKSEIYFENSFLNRKIENDTSLSDAEKYCAIKFNQTYDKRFFKNNNSQINKEINRNCIFLAYGVNLFSKENYDHKNFAEKILEGIEIPLSVHSIFAEYNDEFYNPLRILDELLYIERTSDSKGKQKKEWKIIREVLSDALNQFLDLDEVEKCQIKLNGHKYSFINSKGDWALSELSEGYRANILLIADLLMQILASRKKIFVDQEVDTKNIFAETSGYVLIDEFDRHLHPVWQRQFLSKLKEILPKIQLFVTTHNVFALQSAVGENSIQLSNAANANYVSEKITNQSIIGIIRKYFTTDMFDLKTQETFDEFSKIINDIYDETKEIDFVYSTEFKGIVQNLNNAGGEVQTLLASQLLQLNRTLKQLNKKEFEL